VLGVLDSRRSKLEIYLEVLNIIKNGIYKPTRIMYQANISWQPLMRILGSMISQGLVDEIDLKKQNRKRDKRTSKMYRITLKGEQVIRYFKGAKNFELDDINIPL
jgi:predicted transcriptional regulator